MTDETITMNWYVRIVEDESGEVVEEMGPMSEREATRTANGVSINLNHDQYSVKLDQE